MQLMPVCTVVLQAVVGAHTVYGMALSLPPWRSRDVAIRLTVFGISRQLTLELQSMR
jgi:hypothetical protein